MSNFTGGANLLGGNPVASVVSHPGYYPYVGTTMQSGPSFHPEYNPLSSHALGVPLLSEVSTLGGVITLKFSPNIVCLHCFWSWFQVGIKFIRVGHIFIGFKGHF